MIGLLDWQRPQLLWLTLTLELFSLLTLIGIDRLTTRGLTFASRAWIFALRLIALSLIAISLLRPVLSLSEPSAHRGVIAVLIDESASMGVVDTHRTAAQLTPLAAALDPAVAALRDPALGGLQASLRTLEIAAENLTRAVGELDYAKLSQRALQIPAARLADAQQQFNEQRLAAVRRTQEIASAQSIQQSLETINFTTATTQPASITSTLRAVADAINDLQLQSDQRLCEQNSLVSQAVAALSRDSRLQLIQRSLAHVMPTLDQQFTVQYFGFGQSLRAAKNLDDLSANQPGTDLSTAMRELRQRLVGERIAAVVVCSDGRQTEPASADAVNVGDVPVYAIDPAAAAVQDVAITDLSAPRSLMVGSPALVSTQLTTTLRQPIDATLSITGGDNPLSIRLPLLGPTTRTANAIQINSAGPRQITATLSPQPQEATLANNIFRRWTRVTDQPMRLGIISAVASDSDASLKTALSGNPAWSVQTLPADSVAAGNETILSQDVLVLADLPYDALPDTSWWAIQRWIRDRGGSVLIASTQPSIFAEYAQHESTAALRTWSGDALPTLRSWPGETPGLRITSANFEAVSGLLWADDPEANRQVWRQLPPLTRVLTFPELLPTAQALIVEAQTRLPVLCVQPLGLGRVALLGFDEIDRWKTPLLSPPIFWQRLLEYLDVGSYAVDDGVLAIDADSLAPRPNRNLRLRLKIIAGPRAELEEAFDRPLLRISRDGRPYFSQLLSVPSDAYPFRSEVTLPELPTGNYQITLIWADRKVTLPLSVADSMTNELSNVAGDPANLASLINPRGAVLPIEELPTLAARIEVAADSSPAVITYPLWDSPYFFILVVGCFGADWALRQRLGLA